MKAAIYARKSVQTEKGESIDNQIHLCKDYGLRLGIDDFIIYSDEGFSGGNLKRPKFKKMIADAKNKLFDVLICYRLDRISRNVADFSTTLELLQKNDIDFISIKEQFDTSTPMGRAMVYISSVFAQLERETIAERIKDNMLELSKTGRWLGGTAPLGFTSKSIEYVDNNGKSKKLYKLVEIPEEIDLVKLIFNLYLDKKGFHAVANYLCRNKYKGKNGGEFSRTTVEQIIKNPVYTIADKNMYNYFSSFGTTLCGNFNGTKGIMTYNKREKGKKENPISQWIVAVGAHEGVIPSDVWIQCENISKSKKISPRSGTGNKFLLSGLLICGVCGSTMNSWSRKNSKTGLMERYYRCSLKNRAAKRCSSIMLNANKAEDGVLSNIKDISIESLIENYNELKKTSNTETFLQNEIRKTKNSLENNNKLISNLIRKLALLQDDLTMISEIQNEVKRIKNENSFLKEKLIDLNNSKNNLNFKEKILDDIKEDLKTFKSFLALENDLGKRRDYIYSFIDNIIWDSDNRTLIVNIIGSEYELPNGVIKQRHKKSKDDENNLCFSKGCR